MSDDTFYIPADRRTFIAALRLPVPVSELARIAHGLRQSHGSGIVMSEDHPGVLTFSKPIAKPESAPETPQAVELFAYTCDSCGREWRAESGHLFCSFCGQSATSRRYIKSH